MRRFCFGVAGVDPGFFCESKASVIPINTGQGSKRTSFNIRFVRVRLFYRDGKRQFPASREMKVPVRYVIGRYVDDSVECFLPDYDLVFHCPAIRELPQLIEEAVRTATAQIESRDLAAATPPEHSDLRVVRVRLKEKLADVDIDVTETLAVVADPVFARQRKRRSVPTKHRDSEAVRLVEAMSEASVLMVGPSGCGKTTVAKLAASMHQTNANRIAKLNGTPPPPPLVWQSSAENLIAGMQYLGEWEQRIEGVVAELESINGVLLVSSLIDLVRLGGTQPTDSIAAFLMPYIRRGEIRLVAETTADELDATRRLLPGWAECFQILNIDLLKHGQTRDVADTMFERRHAEITRSRLRKTRPRRRHVCSRSSCPTSRRPVGSYSY